MAGIFPGWRILGKKCQVKGCRGDYFALAGAKSIGAEPLLNGCFVE
jgi:hypothetical protein